MSEIPNLKSETSGDLESLAKTLLDSIRRELGGEWTKLTADERTLIADVCRDAAAWQIRAVIYSGGGPGDDESLKREKRHLSAQLASIASVGADAVREALWRAVSGVLTKALTIAIAAV